MKKVSGFLLVAISLIAFSSCHRDNSTPGPANCTDGNANFPYMALNHQIVYYMNTLYGEDTMTLTFASKNSSGQYKVNATYAHNYFSAPASSTNYACDKDLYIVPGNASATDHYWFSLNANIGDSWTRTESNVTSTYKLLAKNVTVVTYDLGQTFTNCSEFTYYQSGSFNVDTIFFRPDMGEVYYKGLAANYEQIQRNF